MATWTGVRAPARLTASASSQPANRGARSARPPALRAACSARSAYRGSPVSSAISGQRVDRGTQPRGRGVVGRVLQPGVVLLGVRRGVVEAAVGRRELIQNHREQQSPRARARPVLRSRRPAVRRPGPGRRSPPGSPGPTRPGRPATRGAAGRRANAPPDRLGRLGRGRQPLRAVEDHRRLDQGVDQPAIPGGHHLVVPGGPRLGARGPPGAARGPAPAARDQSGSASRCSVEAPSSKVPAAVTAKTSAAQPASSSPSAARSWSRSQA